MIEFESRMRDLIEKGGLSCQSLRGGYMSRSDNTQALYDRKAWYAHSYKCSELHTPWNWRSQCSHFNEFPGSKWKYYSYPQCGDKKPQKFKRALIKNYWNSEKNKAKRVMERHETPSPSRTIASLRWFWD